jgi:hypothetical protein
VGRSTVNHARSYRPGVRMILLKPDKERPIERSRLTSSLFDEERSNLLFEPSRCSGRSCSPAGMKSTYPQCRLLVSPLRNFTDHVRVNSRTGNTPLLSALGVPGQGSLESRSACILNMGSDGRAKARKRIDSTGNTRCVWTLSGFRRLTVILVQAMKVQQAPMQASE